MITREQDFREVRRLLVNPKEQRPDPDLIVSNLLKAEQYLLNRQNVMAAAWAVNTVSVTSISGTAEYTLTPAAGATFGKALFAYRELAADVILPVPFADFTSETGNQRYRFWYAPAEGGEGLIYTGEKLGFFREGGAVKVRIYPIPADERVYRIVYASGTLDWTTFEWPDVPALPEFSHYRQLLAALGVLAACEWEGYTRQENAEFRRELRADLTAQAAMQEQEFAPFIRNTQHGARAGEIGYFWE